MRKIFRAFVSKNIEEKPSRTATHTAEIKNKKQTALRQVSERYGRALTRLSDT